MFLQVKLIYFPHIFRQFSFFVTEETILFNAWYPTKLSVSHGDTIVFNQVLSNIGNGYNSTTGIFTAPKRGSYLFNVQACVPPYGEGSFIIAVRQQSFVETVLNILKYSDTSHHNTVSNSVPVHLARGQEVWVEAWATGKLYHDSSCGSQFSGVLVGI